MNKSYCNYLIMSNIRNVKPEIEYNFKLAQQYEIL
jgi:hypothetical protein